jgi:hypothetical protein
MGLELLDQLFPPTFIVNKILQGRRPEKPFDPARGGQFQNAAQRAKSRCYPRLISTLDSHHKGHSLLP